MSDDNQAPDVTMPQQAPPDLSSPPQTATQAPPPSRLSSILKAVAGTVSNGLAGIPDSGRSSFVTGLGEGTRSAQAAQKQAQDIKFKTFDDSVRAANLHNQDLQIQGRQQEQSDAHQSHQDTQHDWDEAHGIEYDTVPNTADAVTDHLKTQTSANGAASVPAGTHLSADGKSILIPKQTDATQKGQMEQYKSFAPVLGLPSLPQGASFVPPRMLDALTHKMQGYDVSGNNITADKLPGAIASTQSQRDTLATSGGTPAQLKALDNIIGIYKSTLKADNDASNKAADLATKRAKELIDTKAQDAIDVNAAKPQKAAKVDSQMYVGTDSEGNQIAGTGDDLKTAGAKGVTKLEGSDASKVVTARQLTSPQGLFSLINQDMRALDAKGKMGTSAEARFHDALLEKAGSDPDYAPLITHTHLLATALMQAHVGSKGSENMMEEFKNLANAGKMSASTLRSALGAEYKYVHEKAMLPKTPSQEAK